MYFRKTLEFLSLSIYLIYFSPVFAGAGEDFLAKNAKQTGVITTASGLQYKVTKAGDGISPVAADMVSVHYHGTLINGEVFDSSVERGAPTSFALNQVIKGWTEGLQTMKQGGKTTFYIPPDIAYGERAVGSIPANSTLIFEVELLQVFQSKAPKNLAEVQAFQVSKMACGEAPALPKNKSKLASIETQAEEFTACARDYYKQVSMEMDGLIRAAQGSNEKLRDAVLDKLRDSKKAMTAQLDNAVAFVKAYQKLKTQ